ncbi:hypothetical protein EJB05_34472, partial [Eragrostis curvula]
MAACKAPTGGSGNQGGTVEEGRTNFPYNFLITPKNKFMGPILWGSLGDALKGEFYGTITTHTTSILNRIVLYDSEVAGAKTGDGHGVIQLMRSVVSVYVKDMLIIDAKTSAGKW